MDTHVNIDPRLSTPGQANGPGQYYASDLATAMQQQNHPQSHQSNNHISVVIDRERFTQTRNALTSAYVGLSTAVDRAVKAYIDHTDVILQGEGSLDISHLLNPFTGAVGAAQTAEVNIANGINAVTTGTAEATANGDPKKREKRPYKQRDPNAPKRPLTAYFRYLREVRPLIAQEVANSPPTDGTKAGDISKIATERWKQLGDGRRKPYHDAYQSEMGAYEAAVKAYKAAGGKVPPETVTAGEDPEVEGAAEEDDDDEDSSSSEESSDEESTDEEEEVPALPPPPPVKTPKQKKNKAAAAAPAPVATPSYPPPAPVAPMTAPETSSKKRKAVTAGEDAPTDKKKKRGRPSKADQDAAAAASQLQAESSVPAPVEAGAEKKEKKEKKKKRKSEAAAA